MVEETLVLDKPEQLKALGHPLRVRVLETLIHDGESRAVARIFRVAPKLLASGGASDIQAAMIDHVQRAHSRYASKREFRSAQLEVGLSLERALDLMTAFLTATRDLADDAADKIVLTVFAHPPVTQE